MYTEQMTQGVVVAGTPVHPQAAAAGTLTTGATQSIDMAQFSRALFVLDAGAAAGSPTGISVVLTVQESATGTGGWQNNPIAPTLTLTAANTVGTAEIRAGQLSAGMRYARASVAVSFTGGTSPTIQVGCLPLGGEANHKPGSLFKDAAVVSQVVT